MNSKKSIRLAVFLIFLLSSLYLANCTSDDGDEWLVEKGWDLFNTSGASFNFGDIDGDENDDWISFESAPLDSFDFGESIGRVKTGNTDTIVRRKEVARGSEIDETYRVPIEFVALQLVSEDSVDLNLGIGFQFIFATLSETQASTGTMDITLDTTSEGTFDTQFTVYFDIRVGSLAGPIVAQNSITFTTLNIPWARTPPDLANKASYALIQTDPPLEIRGVNAFLNGEDRLADLRILEVIEHQADDHGVHDVLAPVPHDQGGGGDGR